MARLKLNVKREVPRKVIIKKETPKKPITIKETPKKLTKQQVVKKKAAKDHTYIPMNDPENFKLLKDNRHDGERFSRVDKFYVNHYWKVGTEWLREKIFYPSQFGIEELENISKEDNLHPLLLSLEKLRNEGIGLVGKRPKAEIFKPKQRLKLKVKPKRMKLNAKT